MPIEWRGERNGTHLLLGSHTAKSDGRIQPPRYTSQRREHSPAIKVKARSRLERETREHHGGRH